MDITAGTHHDASEVKSVQWRGGRFVKRPYRGSVLPRGAGSSESPSR